ncbi:hypothetical protein VTJ49DRAFT_5338 [Mycothermus thermophilus]|uniref:Uncharacterized protein n=1 Tax=Humicola insolens TaxID=85995 RepID=A0ABR3V3E1_HUMIN
MHSKRHRPDRIKPDPTPTTSSTPPSELSIPARTSSTNCRHWTDLHISRMTSAMNTDIPDGPKPPKPPTPPKPPKRPSLSSVPPIPKIPLRSSARKPRAPNPQVDGSDHDDDYAPYLEALQRPSAAHLRPDLRLPLGRSVSAGLAPPLATEGVNVDSDFVRIQVPPPARLPPPPPLPPPSELEPAATTTTTTSPIQQANHKQPNHPRTTCPPWIEPEPSQPV